MPKGLKIYKKANTKKPKLMGIIILARVDSILGNGLFKYEVIAFNIRMQR